MVNDQGSYTNIEHNTKIYPTRAVFVSSGTPLRIDILDLPVRFFKSEGDWLEWVHSLGTEWYRHRCIYFSIWNDEFNVELSETRGDGSGRFRIQHNSGYEWITDPYPLRTPLFHGLIIKKLVHNEGKRDLGRLIDSIRTSRLKTNNTINSNEKVHDYPLPPREDLLFTPISWLHALFGEHISTVGLRTEYKAAFNRNDKSAIERAQTFTGFPMYAEIDDMIPMVNFDKTEASLYTGSNSRLGETLISRWHYDRFHLETFLVRFDKEPFRFIIRGIKGRMVLTIFVTHLGDGQNIFRIIIGLGERNMSRQFDKCPAECCQKPIVDVVLGHSVCIDHGRYNAKRDDVLVLYSSALKWLDQHGFTWQSDVPSRNLTVYNYFKTDQTIRAMYPIAVPRIKLGAQGMKFSYFESVRKNSYISSMTSTPTSTTPRSSRLSFSSCF